MDLAQLQRRLSAVEDQIAEWTAQYPKVAFAASGSTALGVCAALQDSNEKEKKFLESSADLEELVGRGRDWKGLVVGLSMSGRSVEVLEVLDRAAQRGLPTLLVTNAADLIERGRVLGLGLADVPIRFLPLAAALVASRFLDLKPLREIGSPRLLHLELEKVFQTLTQAWKNELVPVFTSPASQTASLFASQYQEFLKRPAFSVSFPGWTHNLLWSLNEKDSNRFCFLHFPPAADLGDQRFQRVLERLDGLGILQTVVGGWNGSKIGPNAQVQVLSEVLDFFSDLANSLGIDPHREHSF